MKLIKQDVNKEFGIMAIISKGDDFLGASPNEYSVSRKIVDYDHWEKYDEIVFIYDSNFGIYYTQSLDEAKEAYKYTLKGIDRELIDVAVTGDTESIFK